MKLKKLVIALVTVATMATPLCRVNAQAADNTASVVVIEDKNATDNLAPDVLYNKMIALKDSYPEGMRYTNDDMYPTNGFWKGGLFSYGFGCAGFAFMLSDVCFGDAPARFEYPEKYDAKSIRVGDILRINNDTHSVIVLMVKANSVIVAEANYNSSVHWGREIPYTTLNNRTTSYIITRYPKVEVVEDNTVYPSKYYSGGTWIKSGTRWWYKDANGGYPKTCWAKINGKWYLFDKAGWMLTGWQKVSGKWYYLGTSGAMQTGWVKVSGIWYFLENSGAMKENDWVKTDGKWYYLGSNGAMKTGFVDYNYQWYYLNEKGVMQTGWKKIDGTWFYFRGSGEALTGGIYEVNGKEYLFNHDGSMMTGIIHCNFSGWLVTVTTDDSGAIIKKE